jgi:hypothetical protein
MQALKKDNMQYAELHMKKYRMLNSHRGLAFEANALLYIIYFLFIRRNW